MFKKDFSHVGRMANTLPPECLGENNSGWVISGEVQEDYFEWVNYFEAIHPTYGKVWGIFEHAVFADSEEGYEHFVAYHPPEAWDYGEI